ncbi:hypothetical protein B0H11DRAFT_1985317 [Mycena galericulata]|nr:hypothetical protein B0H11DRAFT_1985317 [Mycena galericulata]
MMRPKSGFFSRWTPALAANGIFVKFVPVLTAGIIFGFDAHEGPLFSLSTLSLDLGAHTFLIETGLSRPEPWVHQTMVWGLLEIFSPPYLVTDSARKRRVFLGTTTPGIVLNPAGLISFSSVMLQFPSPAVLSCGARHPSSARYPNFSSRQRPRGGRSGSQGSRAGALRPLTLTKRPSFEDFNANDSVFGRIPWHGGTKGSTIRRDRTGGREGS